MFFWFLLWPGGFKSASGLSCVESVCGAVRVGIAAWLLPCCVGVFAALSSADPIALAAWMLHGPCFSRFFFVVALLTFLWKFLSKSASKSFLIWCRNPKSGLGAAISDALRVILYGALHLSLCRSPWTGFGVAAVLNFFISSHLSSTLFISSHLFSALLASSRLSSDFFHLFSTHLKLFLPLPTSFQLFSTLLNSPQFFSTLSSSFHVNSLFLNSSLPFSHSFSTVLDFSALLHSFHLCPPLLYWILLSSSPPLLISPQLPSSVQPFSTPFFP